MDAGTGKKLSAREVRDLVKRSVRGDMKAFERLFASAERLLFRVGLGLTGSPAEAEEALAETALRVLESLATLRRPEHFYTWATRIMINACYAEGRARQKVVPIGNPGCPEQLEPDWFPGDQRWADFADLRQALSALTPGHRAVVILRYFEDMSVTQVAEVLQIPEGTVKSRLHYALEQLRRSLSIAQVRAGGGRNE